VRAVFDANVLVSALISRTGSPARLVERWLAGEFELVVCEALLVEVERALAYPKVRERVSPADAGEYVRVLRELAEVVADPSDVAPVRSRDAGDDYLLALAAREQAPLISGDAHVLELAGRAPVLTPRAFLEQLASR
jgi:uncharacterized protein